MTGYTTARFAASLGNPGAAAGDHPVATVGPIGLLHTDGVFAVRLVDQAGAPTPMVQVVGHTRRAGYIDFSSGNGVGTGSASYQATSGPDGLVHFTGLPNLAPVGQYVDDSFTVDIPPLKVSGTESYSFLGLSVDFHLGHLGLGDLPAQAPTIVLAGPKTPIAVQGSNIAFLLGTSNFVESPTVPPNGPLTVAFNQAIDPGTVRVQFLAEDGFTPIPAQPVVTVSTNLLSITPSQALVAGARYNVLLHADAALSAGVNDIAGTTEFNRLAPFFVQQAAGVKPEINVNNITKATNGGIVSVTFTLNEPIGIGQGAAFPIDCVAFYEGVNLDNGDPALYPGEWSAGGGMICDFQGSPVPGMNITSLIPVEQTLFGLVTGFASKFIININNVPAVGQNPAPCKPGVPVGACAGPQSGNKIHLVFSRLPPYQTVRRISGQPVTDDPTRLVLTIP